MIPIYIICIHVWILGDDPQKWQRLQPQIKKIGRVVYSRWRSPDFWRINNMLMDHGGQQQTTYNKDIVTQTLIVTISSWWLNQPLWKIFSSKWVHLPQFSVKIQQHMSPRLHCQPENKNWNRLVHLCWSMVTWVHLMYTIYATPPRYWSTWVPKPSPSNVEPRFGLRLRTSAASEEDMDNKAVSKAWRGLKMYTLENFPLANPMTDPWDERYIYQAMNGWFVWFSCR